MTEIVHRRIDVGGINTHYLEGGSGPPLVLLHSGEFGASAELCWERVLPGLAEHHHVIAPDWLGYGETDKLYDFGGGTARRLRHITEFLQAIGLERAVFMGNSMGGSFLAQVAASEEPIWPIETMVLVSGGGFAPDNDERKRLLEYDGTEAAMRELLSVLFHDPTWALRDEYVRRRVELSNVPGAWECVAAARFKSPQVPPRSDFGRPDDTAYELISVPTLLIAGADDRLRVPGYARELGERIPDCRVHEYERCGHVPNLEHPERTVADTLAFLADVDARTTARSAQ